MQFLFHAVFLLNSEVAAGQAVEYNSVLGSVAGVAYKNGNCESTSEGCPLLFALHGIGGDGQGFAQYEGSELKNTFSGITAYLDGYDYGGSGLGWPTNAGGNSACDAECWRAQEQKIITVSSHAVVNQNKVYVTRRSKNLKSLEEHKL